MNTTLTLKLNTTTAKNAFSKTPSFAQFSRTVARKWDMLAVAGLMVSSAAYGVYALTQMTGF